MFGFAAFTVKTRACVDVSSQVVTNQYIIVITILSNGERFSPDPAFLDDVARNIVARAAQLTDGSTVCSTVAVEPVAA